MIEEENEVSLSCGRSEVGALASKNFLSSSPHLPHSGYSVPRSNQISPESEKEPRFRDEVHDRGRKRERMSPTCHLGGRGDGM